MTLLELMPSAPHVRRLRARLKPECNQRISEKAKLRANTERGRAHLVRITELAKTPEARAKLSQTRIRLAETNRRREATLACVDPTYRRCRFCKQFDDPMNMTGVISGAIRRYYHKPCNATAARNWRKQK
jgi:hypothetical protein